MKDKLFGRLLPVLVAAISCLFVYACADGGKKPADGEVSYKNVYLIDRFEPKNASGDEKTVKVMSLSIGGDSRRSLFEHPCNPGPDKKDREVVFPGIELGNNAALKFGIGVREEAYTAVVEGKHLGGIIFRIYVDDGTQRNAVFEQELRPFERKEDRGWHDRSVDLSEYAGKTVGIILLTSYAEGDLVWGHAFWSDPLLTMSYVRHQDEKDSVLINDLLEGGNRNIYLLDTIKIEHDPEKKDATTITDMRIYGEMRKSLFLHPNSRDTGDREAVFKSVKLNNGADLKFGIGVREEAYDAVVEGKRLGGIIFRVYIDDGKERDLFFERTLRPCERKEDRGWHDFSLDLSKYAGETVDIVLSTRYAQGDQVWGHAYWSEPVVENIPTDDFPNIILISVDTLRADHLGCYGYDRDTSPNIDKFARDSVVYKYSFSHAPKTLESHSSIMTSLNPNKHLAFLMGEEKNKKLDERFITIAEILSALGYYTISYNGGGAIRKNTGLNQGFKEYNSFPYNLESPDIVWEVSETAKFITERRSQAKKLFLFFHTYQVHAIYDAPEMYKNMYDDQSRVASADMSYRLRRGDIIGYEREYSKENGNNDFPKEIREHFLNYYDAEIRYTDAWLGNFFDFLKEEGLYDDSLIILVADHGEQFYEHRGWSHRTLYGTELYVPLIVKYPHSTVTGVEDERIARSIDVVPTILYDFLNINITDAPFDGIPLSQPLMDADSLGFFLNEKNLSELGSISVIKGDTKYIYFADPVSLKAYKFKKDILDLKEITVDESTLDDISGIISRENQLFEENVKKRDADREGGGALDEKTKEQLKDLGYL